jgi:LysM repeat protein
MSWVMPFPEKAITGEFGTLSAYRRKHKMQAHSGTDWAPAGSNRGKTLIPAIANGTVRLIAFSKILGWVVVQTAMDKEGKIWHLGYCHLKCKKCGINCGGGHDPEIAMDLRLGDKLKAGDVSHGMVIGNSGSASSGAHLHATASKTIKGVFGPTSIKSDIKKLILKNSGGAVAPKVDKKVAKEILKPKVAAKPAPKAEAPKPAPVVVAEPQKPVIEPKTYTVASGDTLSAIANKFDTTIAEIAKLNNISNVNLINVGQVLKLPA